MLVMIEMENRGYNVDQSWKNKNYRGKTAKPYSDLDEEGLTNPIYREHDDAYYKECLVNLSEKEIKL